MRRGTSTTESRALAAVPLHRVVRGVPALRVRSAQGQGNGQPGHDLGTPPTGKTFDKNKPGHGVDAPGNLWQPQSLDADTPMAFESGGCGNSRRTPETDHPANALRKRESRQPQRRPKWSNGKRICSDIPVLSGLLISISVPNPFGHLKVEPPNGKIYSFTK